MFVPFLRPFLGKQKGTTETKLKFIILDLMPNISEKVFSNYGLYPEVSPFPTGQSPFDKRNFFDHNLKYELRFKLFLKNLLSSANII